MDWNFQNRKDKYEISFTTFGGSFAIEVKSSEKDRTKYARIPIDQQGVFMLKTLVNNSKKLAPEKSEVMVLKTWNQDQKQFISNTVIEICKMNDLSYVFKISTKINNEDKSFKAPISISNKIEFTSREFGDRDRSELGLNYLYEKLNNLTIELELSTRDKKSFYLTETVNRMATKAGVEIAQPKFSKGGGNNYQPSKSTKSSVENSFDKEVPVNVSEDDIPW